MKASRIAILVAAGLAFPAPAWAEEDGCAGGYIAGFCIGIPTDVKPGAIDKPELGTALQNEINTATSTNTAQGTAITGLQSDVGTLQGTVLGHTGDIAALQTNKADVTYVNSQNAAQDGVISGHTTTLANHGGRISTLETASASHEQRLDDNDVKNGEQDDAIADHETRITTNTGNIAATKQRLDVFVPSPSSPGSIESWADGVNSTLGTQGQAISAHSALLSDHTARLDAQAKGLAIAMALPDAWLEQNKRFAIAGSVGGFDGETALGAAAIFRLDDTWSVNIKGGADTGFEEFGWSAGARASW